MGRITKCQGLSWNPGVPERRVGIDEEGRSLLLYPRYDCCIGHCVVELIVDFC